MFSCLLGPAWLRWACRAPHVIAVTSLIGCNTKIIAGIFDMLNFMIMSLQLLATTCKPLLFYFIAARPYNCNKIFHASYFILF